MSSAARRCVTLMLSITSGGALLAGCSEPGAPMATRLAVDVDGGCANNPRAVPGGPYALGSWIEANGLRTADGLILDGSASSDPDMPCGDSLTSYSWDLDGDGVYGDVTGVRPAVSWETLSSLLASRGMTPSQYLANPTTGLPRLSVSLRVTDSTARTHEAVTTMTIWNDMPVASFSAVPAEAGCQDTIAFDAFATYHGRPGGAITAYAWDFDVAAAGEATPDLPQVIAAFSAEASGQTASHSYATLGVFRPVLRAIDARGHSAYAWKTVTVSGKQAPVAQAGGPYTITAGSSLILDGTGTIDADAVCGDSVTCDWDLNGDGLFSDATGCDAAVPWAQLSALLTPAVQYPADPVTGLPKVQIRLRATDKAGLHSQATADLTVYASQPVAIGTWGPQPAVLLDNQGRGTVLLDGSASHAGSPDRTIALWDWRLKGATSGVQGRTASLVVNLSPLPEPFPEAGLQRTVALTVTDSTGASSKVELTATFVWKCAGIVCTALDQCHVAGTCDPATGSCSTPARTDETPCDDGNACTVGEVCRGGSCDTGASSSLSCDDSDSCTGDTCSPSTGCGHALTSGCCSSAHPCGDGFVCRNALCEIADVPDGAASDAGEDGGAASDAHQDATADVAVDAPVSGDAADASRVGADAADGVAGPDAGADAGRDKGGPSSGCGCRAAGRGHASLLLLLLAALLGHRRRRGRSR